MINTTYLYIFISFLGAFALLKLFFNLRPNKNHLNNKILLRNLLQSFELELPEELKQLDNASPDTQKLS
tara:strand:- start:119 stop:325 length:207 start_codon:yes stop_codon:yes gene_type:complete